MMASLHLDVPVRHDSAASRNNTSAQGLAHVFKCERDDINVISHTCAFHFVTCQNVCGEKRILCFNKYPAVIAWELQETSKSRVASLVFELHWKL